MKQIVTRGIVLSRTNFQEADRILTILTPDQGKLHAIAKGARRSTSKLAGGIELFSVSHMTFLPGKKDLGTLISSRLIKHYENIVKDIDRTMLGYELTKRINRITEDAAGEEYFTILNHTLAGLDDLELSSDLVELWFTMQLLHVTGHLPNLKNDTEGNKLDKDQVYLFDFEAMAFQPTQNGPYGANHIKLLRLAYATNEPGILKQVKEAEKCATDSLKLAKNLLSSQVRV